MVYSPMILKVENEERFYYCHSVHPDAIPAKAGI
jgi:hypothetical protein